MPCSCKALSTVLLQPWYTLIQLLHPNEGTAVLLMQQQQRKRVSYTKPWLHSKLAVKESWQEQPHSPQHIVSATTALRSSPSTVLQHYNCRLPFKMQQL